MNFVDPLMDAIQENDVATLESLLEVSGGVIFGDKYGDPVTMLAAELGFIKRRSNIHRRFM